VQNELGRITDTFDAFVDYLKEDFAGASDVAWDMFLAGMELASRAAIDLAIRTGKGMWAGIKEGIFGGENAQSIHDEAMERYIAQGGATVQRQIRQMPTTANGYSMSKTVTDPLFESLDAVTGPGGAEWMMRETARFEQIKSDIRAERMAKTVDAIMGEFGDVRQTLRKATEKARKDIESSVNRAALTDSGAKFRSRFEEIGASRDAARAALDAQYAGTQELRTVFDYIKVGLDKVHALYVEAERRAVESGQPLRSSKLSTDGADALSESALTARQKIVAMQDALKKEMEIIGRLDESHKRAADAIEYETQVRKNAGYTLEEQNALLREYQNLLKQLERQEKLVEMGREFGDAWGQALEDFAFDAQNAGQAAQRLAEDIARLFFRQQISEPIAKAMGDWFINVGQPKDTAGTNAAVTHSGLRAGAMPTVTRNLPLSLFANAPPLHTGLRSDEFPAILQRGEEVLSKAEVQAARTLPQPVFNITNQSSAQVEAQQTRVQFDGRRMIVGMVLTDKRNNGPMARANRRR